MSSGSSFLFSSRGFLLSPSAARRRSSCLESAPPQAASPPVRRRQAEPCPFEVRCGERKMSTNSKAGSDPVDLEKRAAVAKAAAEELAVVDQRKAYWIRRSLDIFFVVYLLFSIGVVAAMVMVSNNWWDPWPGVLIMSPICIGTLYLTPKMKDVYICLYATKQAPSCSDLTTKLLGSQK